jgi:multidrug resistance protein, MATE family
MSMREEARAASSFTARVASLAWPIVVGQLAVIMNGVMDTMMTARYSAIDLAALGLGASVYVSIFVGLSGVMQALSPTIGQLYGAKKYDAIGHQVRQGVWLAIFLSLVGSTLLLFPDPLLNIAEAPPQLDSKVREYLALLSLALPATLGFRVFAALNTAVSRPRIVMTIQVGTLLLLKLPLNALLIFGGLGLPALGTPGAAIATCVAAWLALGVGWLIAARGESYRQFQIQGHGFEKPSWSTQRTLLKLGLPMGMSYLIEVTAFTFMALFIARLGSETLAAHQIAGNFGTVLYMLPLSIASATGILVAQEIGAGKLSAARHAGDAGIRLGVLVAVSIGLLVYFSRVYIVALYTPDPQIAAIALNLFLFISFYQFVDAMQVGAAFVLRAYKVATIPTLMYAIGLWGIGLGGGYLLGFDVFGNTPAALRGAAGFWLGNSISLGLVAAALYWYLRRVQGLREAEG